MRGCHCRKVRYLLQEIICTVTVSIGVVLQSSGAVDETLLRPQAVMVNVSE